MHLLPGLAQSLPSYALEKDQIQTAMYMQGCPENNFYRPCESRRIPSSYFYLLAVSMKYHTNRL